MGSVRAQDNSAGPAGTRKLTVDDCVAIGLKNSKSLHASSMNVQAANAQASQATAARLPSVTLNGSYTRLSTIPGFVLAIPNLGTFDIPTSYPDNYVSQVSVREPIFTGFKLESGSAAADDASKASEQDYAGDRSNLTYTIKASYWGLFQTQEIKKVVDENVEEVSSHLNDVKNMLDHGMATNNDYLRVQVQLSNAQLMQIDAQNNVRLATIALDNVMSVDLGTQVEIASAPDAGPDSMHGPDVPASVDTLVKKAIGNRPELKAMQYRVKAAESGVTAAKSGWYPQVALFGDYMYSNPNQRYFPALNEFKDSWDLGVSASWAIWNWNMTGKQAEQAEAQEMQTQDALGQMQDGVTLEVNQNFLDVRQSADKIRVSAQGVKQAEESYRVMDEKFKAGLALNSDLLDAETALLQARTNYTQSLVDFELAQARLAKSVGE
jgi:outer membrane protein TolC